MSVADGQRTVNQRDAGKLYIKLLVYDICPVQPCRNHKII
jgi:hypothetical protein